jgi:hypothetical protein
MRALAWQVVDHTDLAVMAGVEIRGPVIAPRIEAVLQDDPLRVERCVIERLRPLVVSVELQALAPLLMGSGSRWIPVIGHTDFPHV